MDSEDDTPYQPPPTLPFRKEVFEYNNFACSICRKVRPQPGCNTSMPAAPLPTLPTSARAPPHRTTPMHGPTPHRTRPAVSFHSTATTPCPPPSRTAVRRPRALCAVPVRLLQVRVPHRLPGPGAPRGGRAAAARRGGVGLPKVGGRPSLRLLCNSV